MAKNVTKLTVFVSSPGGIDEDRSVVEFAVDEANKILSQDNVMLSTYAWERDAVPGKAKSYSQQIINEAIDSETDLMIVLMHNRVGSSTPNAASGTIEEFDRFHAIIGRNEKVGDICIYFSIAPVSPLTDAEQLGLVQEFRKRVQGLGYLTRDYDSTVELRASMIAHLVAKARMIASTENAGESKASAVASYAAISTLKEADHDLEGGEADEYGPLDYEEIATELVQQAAEAITKVGSIVQRYAVTMQKDAQEMEKIGEAVTRGIQVSRVAAIDKFCMHLNDHLDEIEPVIADLDEKFADGISATLGLVQEWIVSSQEGKKAIWEFTVVVNQTAEAIAELRDETVRVPLFFEQWPGLTKNLKISKRRGVRVYKKLHESLQRSGQMLDAIVQIGRARAA